MNFIELDRIDGVAIATLGRGKVNAINGALVDELRDVFRKLELDSQVRAVVLTGRGKFFSFGFDVPEILLVTKDEFINFLKNFTELYSYLFLYPKPLVAALNGHAIAGGCMLALTCDTRLMVTGNAKIALNEITFGSSVLVGSVEMLRFLAGNANATEVLYSGKMYTAAEAKSLGLVQEVVSEQSLADAAKSRALDLAAKDPIAFAGIKSLLRKKIGEEMTRREGPSILELADLWYSESTRAELRNIKIHD
jgi:Delta3-Delta2-enoyl-CoA isomerase